jgi:hypothetical protein
MFEIDIIRSFFTIYKLGSHKTFQIMEEDGIQTHSLLMGGNCIFMWIGFQERILKEKILN